ncbi:MAG: helix-turn-helix domain-containing protein [Actinomycetota bacterium]
MIARAPAVARRTGASPLADREETRARILQVARERFRANGVQKTTMEDIAHAAGTSRQVIYRFFSGRGEIVEAAIVERIREMAAVLAEGLDRYSTFAEVMVEVSLATIEAARHDQELQGLFENTNGIRLHHVLAGPQAAVANLVEEFWRPWFQRARQSGELRTDVDDRDLVEWIRGVYLMLILRDDLDADREREILQRYLLPSLSVEAASAAAAPAPVRRRRRSR